ncbi:MAG: hypothetical protein JXR05_14465 [Flavobacteriaceae bacterium]
MKLKYLALSIVLLFTSALIDSDIQDSKTDLLCKEKWYVKYIEANGNKQTPPPGQVDEMWMNFLKDGNHEVNSNNRIQKGKWAFTKNKDSITFTTEKGELKKTKIETLNKKELNLKLADQGQVITIHLERKE